MGFFKKIKKIFSSKKEEKDLQEKKSSQNHIHKRDEKSIKKDREVLNKDQAPIIEDEVIEQVEDPVIEDEVVEQVKNPVVEDEVVEQVEDPVIEDEVVEQVKDPVVEDEVVEQVGEPVIEDEVVEQVEDPVIEDEVVEQVEDPVIEDEVVEQVGDPVIEDEVVEQVEDPVIEDEVVEQVEDPVIEDEAVEQVGDPVIEDEVVEQVEDPVIEDEVVKEVEATVIEDEVVEQVEEPVIEDEVNIKQEKGQVLEGGEKEAIKKINETPETKTSFFDFSSENKKKKLDESLSKTKSSFWGKLNRFFASKNKIDATILEELEELLISSDMGVSTTVKIIDSLEDYVAKKGYLNEDELMTILKSKIVELISVDNKLNIEQMQSKKPYVIMFVGVNGVGKTTTIGKLAKVLKNENKKVLIGAADTFRAAAIEQMSSWADRVDVPIVKQKIGSDPASVVFDTIQSALSKDIDYVLIDTAGRLHNKVNLMNELLKIKTVCSKLIPDSPHELVLALDASTGQNALEQAKNFVKVIDINHLALTKLDGTAKGGVVIGICDQLNIPIKYLGVGEGVDDLQLFDKQQFVDSLFIK